MKSRIDLENENYEKALQNVQEALNANTAEFNDPDIFQNPKLDGDCINNKLCLSHMVSKVKLSWKAYRNSNDKKYLKLAEESVEDAVENFDFLINSLTTTKSKLQLFKVFQELFDIACLINFEQYQDTKEEKFVANIFKFMESSKSIGLREALMQLEIANHISIPKDLKLEMDSIQIRLKKLNSKKASLVSQGKYEELSDLKDNIQKFQNLQSKVISKISSASPDYNILLNAQKLVTLKSFQQSLGERGFLSFLEGEENLYILYTNKERSIPLKVEFDADKKEILNTFYTALLDVNSDDWKEKGYRTFLTFFSGLRDGGIHMEQELVISPDGAFSKLPFETLSYDLDQDSSLWLYKHDISYAYSANVQMNQKKRESANKLIAGFTAEYGSNAFADSDTFTNAPLAMLVRSGEFSLAGAGREVEEIAKIFDGDSYLHTTPKLFKEKAKDYKIIHLATHGIINDNNPMMSSFLLEADDVNNKLTALDLYNMDLNASLAVLSACESGVGELNEGEGLMSLARAFAYTGVPSSVMTLWKVADVPSTDLMLGFYEKIKEENKINSALKLAKQEFIQNASTPSLEHPYFWAGYVAIGDTSKIDGSSSGGSKFYYWILGALVGLLIARFLLKSK